MPEKPMYPIYNLVDSNYNRTPINDQQVTKLYGITSLKFLSPHNKLITLHTKNRQNNRLSKLLPRKFIWQLAMKKEIFAIILKTVCTKIVTVFKDSQ